MTVTPKVAGAVFVLLSAIVPARPARAEGYSWLRSENKHVREGNEKLVAGDAKAALGAYDLAARELPSEGGVHLNRGLALMKSGDTAAARTALKLATQPPASANVRADAYYNLGIGFYKDADAHATKSEHDEAQKLFREASDAFKQSLRLRPGDRNTAWNYELGARRVREQQKKQKEQQDKDKQKKDEENKDQQKQDDKDQQSSDEKQDGKDEQKKDPQDDKKQDKPEDKQAQKDKQAEKDKQAQKDRPEEDEQKQQQKPEKLRPDVAQALDALQDGEQNLERLRAAQRASSEQRTPEKDW